MIGEATFEAADAYTVTLKMQQPCTYVNELMAGLGQRAVVMPKSVLDALDETGIVTEYIGTGPYKFSEWVEHQYIHITRNDDYQPYGTEGEFNGWSGYKTAATKDIYFDLVSDAATVVAGMQTGEYDATTDITADNIALFQDNPDFVVDLRRPVRRALVAAGHRADGGAGRQRAKRDRVAGGRVLPGRGAHRPGLRDGGQGADLHRGHAGRGRAHGAHPAGAHRAQHTLARHRAGVLCVRLRHHHRGGAQLPGRGRSRARTQLGQHKPIYARKR